MHACIVLIIRVRELVQDKVHLSGRIQLNNTATCKRGEVMTKVKCHISVTFQLNWGRGDNNKKKTQLNKQISSPV